MTTRSWQDTARGARHGRTPAAPVRQPSTPTTPTKPTTAAYVSRSSVRRARAARRRRWWLALMLAVLLPASAWVWARSSSSHRARAAVTASTAFSPVADTYVTSARPTTNFGAGPILRTSSRPKIFSYLAFSLEGLSGTVTGATLRLWSDQADPKGLAVHWVASPWNEGALTAASAPALGSTVSQTGKADGRSWVSGDVSRLVSGNGLVNLAITQAGTGSGQYDSRESAHPPELVVVTDRSTIRGASPAASLRSIVENARDATGKRYGTRDDQGRSMDTLKIIQSPVSGYLGVYHSGRQDAFAVHLAVSGDLLHWKHVAQLDADASQPTLVALSDSGFLLVDEASGDRAAGRRARLRFRHYASPPALFAGKADRSFEAPHLLAAPRGGAEGTPNVRSAVLSPDLGHSRIEVGFHYLTRQGLDREGLGTLVDFAAWSARPASTLDAALAAQGAAGKNGDRDAVGFLGATFEVVEAQAALDAPWSVYLFDEATGQAARLQVRTDKGSSSFANPTVSLVRSPSGAQAAAVTLFVPSGQARAGEAGELVYYREYGRTPASRDPVVGAAGDIACAPNQPVSAEDCHQGATADLLVSMAPSAVLALGDEQYDTGTLAGFEKSYHPSWGRLKSITHPVPGNHEYLSGSAAGYYHYYGAAAGDRSRGYYSFDLGGWHLVALNGECAHVGSCAANSPQLRWLAADLGSHPSRCTLAYWHEPRFSSGEHGNETIYDAFWRVLYRFGVDLVLNGHDHDYERFAPQTPDGVPDAVRGIREFIVGTGGKGDRRISSVKPNSQILENVSFGVLALTLRPDSYQWRFVPEPGQTFTDAGTDRCH